MIIWIASYPKSGNTWVRSLLSSYLYSKEGNFDFELLEKIQQFPSKQHLKYFLTNYKDIKTVSDYWIAAQYRINLNKNINFLKTHSALCTFEKNSFTDKSNTKAVIYIVRDPRNIITSLNHHYSLSIKESFDFLTNKNQMLVGGKHGSDDFGMSVILGNWSEHYKSWNNIKFAPLLIVRYEDLIADTSKTFLSILNFLNNFMKIEIDKKKFSNTINACSFDSLSKKEKTKGFKESVVSKKNNNKLKFFNLGIKNNWKNLLDVQIERNIRSVFSKEMKELKYI